MEGIGSQQRTNRIWRQVLAAVLGLALSMAMFLSIRAVADQTGCLLGTMFGRTAEGVSACGPTPPNTITAAAVLPVNFQESIVFSGLDHPTAVSFSPDGRVFVAQKNGVIRVFPNLTSSTPTSFADLRLSVHNYWDRGLLGLAVDPGYPARPYVYALYTYDAPIGGTAPTWNDGCPTPPGATTDGCVASGRLVRLTADPATGYNTMLSGGEQVLINDWCQQFPSHSIGQLVFGPDGMLYVSGGDGADFNRADYGQFGNTYSGDQLNPCGDPPAGVGGVQSPPTAEGGALRAQSLRRKSGEPVVLSGAILRLDPATGLAASGNPLSSSTDVNARRIVAHGFRNPFRFTIRPGTNEIWVADAGWATWEEIDRIVNPTASPVGNFGWPCYEGNNTGSSILSNYQSAGLDLCSQLYNAPGSVLAPYYAYDHTSQIVSGEACPTAPGSVISGIAFYNGGSYPTSYNGALFFGDHSRNCIWVMSAGSNGLPDKTKISNFVIGAANPVDLEIGPGGDLFYVDFDGGTIRRIQYASAGNQPPVAVVKASPTNGAAPLTVSFDGTGSYDPDSGDSIAAYSWDLNGDGVYGDSTSASPTHTYTTVGNYTVTLQVTDKHGASSTGSVVISVANTPPTAVIDSPAGCSTSAPCWAVGDLISFSGHATDQQDGAVSASALSWTIILHHCPSNVGTCHTHDLQTFSGVSTGSFSAPDHDYPAYLEVRLTATDSGGLQNTASVLLYPKTVTVTLNSSPSGLQLVINSVFGTTPVSHVVIVNSTVALSANSPQNLGGVTYQFQSWSDGGAQSHNVVAGQANAAYTATFGATSTDVKIVKTAALSADRTSVIYTLQVTNAGPAQAANVVTRDTLPSKVALTSTSSSSTQVTCSGTTTVSCSLGTLSSGQVVEVTILARIAKQAGFISNTATVTSTTSDLNTGNNSSTVQIKAR